MPKRMRNKNVDDTKATSGKAAEPKPPSDAAEAAAMKKTEPRVRVLLNKEKSIKLQINALNGHTEPEVHEAKAALQND